MDSLGYVLIGIIVLMIFIVIKAYFDENMLKKRLHYQLEKEWGKIPDTQYTTDKFEAIQQYYRENKGEFDVDDITWNDIDMDTIFMLMNNTNCAMGEEYLYAVLRKLKFEEKELLERERLIAFFQKNKEKRSDLQATFRIMGKLKLSLYQYINSTEQIPSHNAALHYCMAFSIPISILLIIFGRLVHIPVFVGVLALIVCLFNNTLQYYKRKASIEKYFNIFMYILRVLDGSKEVSRLDIPELDEYLNKLKVDNHTFDKFKRGSFLLLIDTKRGEGGLGDIFLDYIRILFHVDLIKFDTMLSEVRKNQKVLNRIFETIGLLDSMIAVASFRTWLGAEGYCLPILENSQKPFLEIKAAYHPMIEEPVVNSINENRCVLITGSNASGKSTFIKTMAMNAILAQTIHTSIASAYHASYFKIYSSMALRDDLQGKDSYYIVEIKSLKRILEKISADIPTLCFVDEVLRGTNTLERIAASAQILNSLSKNNALCFAATHDLELTHILEKSYSNYHFQEQIKDNEILFDYQLYEGRAVSRNAIKLLRIMGYQEEIIEKAEQTANHFLETGVWKNLQ